MKGSHNTYTYPHRVFFSTPSPYHPGCIIPIVTVSRSLTWSTTHTHDQRQPFLVPPHIESRKKLQLSYILHIGSLQESRKNPIQFDSEKINKKMDEKGIGAEKKYHSRFPNPTYSTESYLHPHLLMPCIGKYILRLPHSRFRNMIGNLFGRRKPSA